MRQSMTQNIIPRWHSPICQTLKDTILYNHSFQCHTSYIPECHTYYATKYDEKCATEYKPYCKVQNIEMIDIEKIKNILLYHRYFEFTVLIARRITQRSTRPNIRRSVRFIMRKNATGNIWIHYSILIFAFTLAQYSEHLRRIWFSGTATTNTVKFILKNTAMMSQSNTLWRWKGICLKDGFHKNI